MFCPSKTKADLLEIRHWPLTFSFNSDKLQAKEGNITILAGNLYRIPENSCSSVGSSTNAPASRRSLQLAK